METTVGNGDLLFASRAAMSIAAVSAGWNMGEKSPGRARVEWRGGAAAYPRSHAERGNENFADLLPLEHEGYNFAFFQGKMIRQRGAPLFVTVHGP